MSAFRKKWLLALCMSAMAIVSVQVGLCAAEHAGLLPCAEQSSGHCESPSQESDESTSHCCHAHSHSGFVSTTAQTIFAEKSSEKFTLSHDTVPDSFVREIEYPPQLS